MQLIWDGDMPAGHYLRFILLMSGTRGTGLQCFTGTYMLMGAFVHKYILGPCFCLGLQDGDIVKLGELSTVIQMSLSVLK